MNKKILTILLFIASSLSFSYSETDVKKLKFTGVCEDCDFSGLVFSKDDFGEIVEISFGKSISTIDLTDKNLNGSNFKGANLSNVNLSHSTLERTNFEDANLSGAIFRNANISGALVYGANFTAVDLSQTEMQKVSFEKVILCGTIMPWGIEDSGCTTIEKPKTDMDDFDL